MSRDHDTNRLRVTRCLVAAAVLVVCGAAQGQGYVPVSIKIIHDGTPPMTTGGQFTTPAQLMAAVDQANAILAGNMASWELVCCEIVTLPSNGPTAEYLDLNDGTCGPLPTVKEFDTAAKQNPVAFQWRYDAVNVYVVNSICQYGPNLAAGFALQPLGEDSLRGGAIVVLANENEQETYIGGNVLLHEVCHHLSLTHFASPAAFHEEECHCIGPDPIGSVPPCAQRPYGGCDCSFTMVDNIMQAAGLLESDPLLVTIDPCQMDHMELELGIDPPPPGGMVSGSRMHELRTSPNCGFQDFGWRRGDCDGDGLVDFQDVKFLLYFLYDTVNGTPPACMDACDANDDGLVDGADPILMISVLGGSGTLPAPYPQCGEDPTSDSLTCTLYLGC